MEAILINGLILRALKNASSIGMTPKQIMAKVGYSEETITKSLNTLCRAGKVSVIGRNLWILSKFIDISRDKSFRHPRSYVETFEREQGIAIQQYNGKITFSDNGARVVHQWSPYVQGFSASFVENIFSRFGIGRGSRVLDPYVGVGTALICARLRGASSIGIDVMPLMAFASQVKTDWGLDTSCILTELERIKKEDNQDVKGNIPFLKKTREQFSPNILTNLLRLKHPIMAAKNKKIRNLLLLAFASILVDVSKLKRSPALGYANKKSISDEAPYIFFEHKVKQMIRDLIYMQGRRDQWGPKPEVICRDVRKVKYKPNTIDLAITSPPYVNGMDYVMNYKLEMAWLDMVKDYADLTSIKNKMVACDNLSKKVIRKFAKREPRFQDKWLDDIIKAMKVKLDLKGNYRRNDMDLIVQKYFDDVYPVFESVYEGLKPGGRFVLVIGDSLIAGTYVPTDLLLARMGKKAGFEIESVERARNRRSGQRRSFALKESIVTLVKGPRDNSNPSQVRLIN